MARFRVHGMKLMLRVEVHGRRGGEAFRDDFERCRIHIDAGDLFLEPERSIELAIRVEVEAVESTHPFHDLAGRVCACGIKFIKRITKENLCGEEATIFSPGK